MPDIARTWVTVTGAYGYRIHAGPVSGLYTEVSANIPADRQPDVAGYLKSGTITVSSAGTWYVAVAAYDALGYEGVYSAEQTIITGTVGAPTGAVVLALVDL